MKVLTRYILGLSPLGKFVFKLNDEVISDEEYQTKSLIVNHAILFGEYWDKGYNTENDPFKKIVIRIDEFTVSYALNN